MLTRKQLDLLNYINKHLNKDGIPPSFDEMKEALDLRSKSGIHRLITALEERGFIRRLAHRARAIEIVKLPDSLETNNNVTELNANFSKNSKVYDRKDIINVQIELSKINDIEILGPIDSPLLKIRKHYRSRLLIRFSMKKLMQKKITNLLNKLKITKQSLNDIWRGMCLHSRGVCGTL